MAKPMKLNTKNPNSISNFKTPSNDRSRDAKFASHFNRRVAIMSSVSSTLLSGILLLCTISLVALIICIVACRIKFRKRAPASRRPIVIAFFHPYCSAGGGGERVLWKAVQVLGELQQHGLALEVVIYTIDKPRANYKEEVLRHVQTRFSITPPSSLPLKFVHLDEYVHFLDRRSRFSLLAESWGTMKLAYKALEQVTPHVFFDTTGCAFTYFVARVLAGCQVAAYVHYPTLSTDMLSLVWQRRPSYNHNVDIAKSRLVTYVKLVYYSIFAVLYGFCGSLARLVMVNSTWTYGHICFLWRGARSRITVVFPPCDVESLKTLPLENRERVVLSIGQFRPEKDHELQIRSFAKLCDQNSNMRNAKLVLLGSCRGKADEARVQQYRRLVKSLGLDNNVEFVLNQPYSVVKDWLARASVGLHTMWNEHFGIGVVEMMAAGLLVVAHASGGPKSDIIVPSEGKQTGFLASSCEEYAECMKEALGMDKFLMLEMRESARESAVRFSDEVFSVTFKTALVESGILR